MWCYLLSRVQLFATPWSVTCQVHLSRKEFSRQEYWVTIPFSRGSSWSRDRTWVSRIAGRFFAIWDTRETPSGLVGRCQLYQHFVIGVCPICKRMPLKKFKPSVCFGIFCFIATSSSPVSVHVLSASVHTGHTRKLVNEIQYLFQTSIWSSLMVSQDLQNKSQVLGGFCLTRAP